MRYPVKRVVGLVAGAALLVGAPTVAALERGGHRSWDADRDLEVVGLTQEGKLIRFEEDSPWKVREVGKVRGLKGDTRLVGIDYRPASGNDGSRGVLYGVGEAGGVYTVDERSGWATKRSQLSVALEGRSFGVDFNPVVDRLRIVSDTGQNLRDNVDADGDTIADGRLTYPPAPPAQPMATPAMGVAGAAYTNNDADPATGTTLFDLDAMLDQTVIQAPANAGLLSATGKLGVDTGTAVGADIYSTIRGGTTVDVRGLASLTVGGKSRLYGLDLLQGRARDRGAFPAKHQLTGIAIPLNQL
jgi:hypothetical protein